MDGLGGEPREEVGFRRMDVVASSGGGKRKDMEATGRGDAGMLARELRGLDLRRR